MSVTERNQMRLNKQTTYAVQTLLACTQAGDGLIKVSTIAGAIGLTQAHALKIAHALMRGGLLINQRGRNGGIRLARPAQDIRIGDVVRVMEATQTAADSKIIADVIDDAFAAFVAVLDQHTIADLARRKPARTTPKPAPTTKPRKARPKRAQAAPVGRSVTMRS